MGLSDPSVRDYAYSSPAKLGRSTHETAYPESIEQDILGPVDAGRKIGAAADVGMHALDQAPMGSLDLLRSLAPAASPSTASASSRVMSVRGPRGGGACDWPAEFWPAEFQAAPSRRSR